MTAVKSQLPVRSPIPFIVPCTCMAPASSEANALANANPESSWVCMPIAAFTADIAARVQAATSSGSDPPFVSHKTMREAPASAAALKQANAY